MSYIVAKTLQTILQKCIIKKQHRFQPIALKVTKRKNKPILYYNDVSPPVRSVLMTIQALDLKLDLKFVDLFAGEQSATEYIKMNPLHTVPMMIDDDLTITDSHAICTYLINEFAPGSMLYSSCSKDRAKVDNILYFNNSVLFPRESAILQSMFNPNRDILFSVLAERYIESLGFLENFCKKSTWLGGDQITLADLVCISTYSSGELIIQTNKDTFPYLNDWASRCKEQSIYLKANLPGLENLKMHLRKFGNFDHVNGEHKRLIDQLFEYN